MKLLIEHTFAVTPAEYARLYFDEAFSVDLCASVRLGRKLLRLDRSSDRIVRHVRCEPERDVPAPLAKLLDGHRFHYVEEIDFDLAKRSGRWRVVPSLLPEKVIAGGTLDFELAPGGKTKRVVRGDVTIAVFGVGAIMERFVAADVHKTYDQASAFTASFLSKRAS